MKKIDKLFKEIKISSSVDDLKKYFLKKHQEDNQGDKQKVITTINKLIDIIKEKLNEMYQKYEGYWNKKLENFLYESKPLMV